MASATPRNTHCARKASDAGRNAHPSAIGSGHREGPTRVGDEAARLQLRACVQHDEEHAEIGNGVEHGVVLQAADFRNQIGVHRGKRAEHDAGNQLANQGRLPETLCDLAEAARGHLMNSPG